MEDVTVQDGDRLDRAMASLAGLSVGDAFGEQFFDPDAQAALSDRRVPAGPWPYTDDTQMALSVVQVLARHGQIEQDALARSFAAHYEPPRGYGPAMHRALRRIGAGEPWADVAGGQFEGQGSYGNGAAMRAAPIGAYFADDLDGVAGQATRSAVVTHAHPEGVAGAVAVAIAAALACRARQNTSRPSRGDFLDSVVTLLAPSEVRSGIRRARDLSEAMPVRTAAAILGDGSLVSAQDTVPFALWCAARHLEDFEEALWATVTALGDRDTTCAIVGGIVACYVGVAGIPAAWLAHREPLPDLAGW
jgi:ADP-ribosylglycohydrolase